MIKKFKARYLVYVLFLALLIAALYNYYSTQFSEYGIIVNANGKAYAVSYEDLSGEKFSGTLVNGKGEKTDHSYVGVALNNVLKKKGITISDSSVITVKAADNYEAKITGAEVLAGDKVYIAVQADGAKIDGIESGKQGYQLIVFGDSNSKRCVRYLSSLTVE